MSNEASKFKYELALEAKDNTPWPIKAAEGFGYFTSSFLVAMMIGVILWFWYKKHPDYLDQSIVIYKHDLAAQDKTIVYKDSIVLDTSRGIVPVMTVARMIKPI